MRLSYKLRKLKEMIELVKQAQDKWKDYKLLCDPPEDMAHNSHLDNFAAEASRLRQECEDEIDRIALRFSIPVLKAKFYNPSRKFETMNQFIVRGPDEECDEPHIMETSWNCIVSSMGDDIEVDEDFDVYVLSQRRPRRALKVIKGARK